MSLVERVKNILLSPQTEWPVIAGEGATVQSLFVGYIIPLALIGPVLSIIYAVIFGGGYGLIAGVVLAAVILAIDLAVTFAVAFIAGAVAPSFGGRNDLVQALKLIAYASTAVWLAAIISSLIPFLFFIPWIAMLYALYLIYLGAGPVLGVPQDKTVVFTLVILAVKFGIAIVEGIFFTTITLMVVGMFAAASMH
jgi:hypothetical protein